MKKIVASVGLVALSASGLQAAGASGITGDESKPWSISATLRGFYDDNINSVSDDFNLIGTGGKEFERDSFGFEISPSVSLIMPLEQGSLTAAYTYGYKYYDNELFDTASHDVQTHVFNLGLDHAFSERYQISLKDSFVLGQEPDVLRAGNAMETFQTIPGDNMRNAGAINFDGMMTRELGYQIGYGNNWFDYDDPTTAGLLNRIENIPHVDLRWQVQPQTVGILGYQFRGVDYTAGQNIAGDGSFSNPFVQSDIRNSTSHYGYIGMDHTFRPDFTGSFRVGVNYSDYYNDPTTDTKVSPYILANLRYTYTVDSFFELGLTTDRNATDVVGNSADGFTMDQQSTVVYASVTHAFTPKLFGTVLGQYQYSTFNGGQYNNQAENFFSAGLNLEYRFSRYFGAHIGYNFDALDSDLGDNRNFDRNRVFVGVTARY